MKRTNVPRLAATWLLVVALLVTLASPVWAGASGRDGASGWNGGSLALLRAVMADLAAWVHGATSAVGEAGQPYDRITAPGGGAIDPNGTPGSDDGGATTQGGGAIDPDG